jgi:hypothetical protein
MSDEHPFISGISGGLDEGELDPVMDAARLREQTGERWLSFSEAVALLREREPISIGQAQAIIDDLWVAYFAGGGLFPRRSGKSAPVRWYFVRGIGLLGEKPHRENTLVNEPDLIYWHDRNRDTVNKSQEQRASPSSAEASAEAIEKHTSPTVDRATIAISRLYPQEIPPQATLRNKQLIADVNGELARMGLKAVSETTVLRAAGRRKK